MKRQPTKMRSERLVSIVISLATRLGISRWSIQISFLTSGLLGLFSETIYLIYSCANLVIKTILYIRTKNNHIIINNVSLKLK